MSASASEASRRALDSLELELTSSLPLGTELQSSA